MNKEKIKKQHNLLLYFATFMAIALIVAAILRVLTPTKEQVIESDFVSKNYDKTETTFKKVVFIGDKIEVPDSFAIFRPTNSHQQAELLAKEFINKYDLVQDEKRSNYWLTEDKSLIHRSAEKEYVFYDHQKKEVASDSAIINQKIAIQNCEDYLNNFDINIKLEAQENSIIYLDELGEEATDNLEEAIELRTALTFRINNYPVFFLNENEFPFYCSTDKEQKVKSFVFKDLLYKFEESKELESISIDKAVNNISKGKASIIDAKNQNIEIFDLSYIQTAELKKVQIDYRYDDQLQILYPFYRFQAKIVNMDGINIDAEIITPAIESAQEK